MGLGMDIEERLIGPGYCIRLDAARRFVEAWTAWRLPFETSQTPAQKGFCFALGPTIRKLRSDGKLDASYFEPEGSRTKADLENLLFYNVGTSHFHDVAAEAQRFAKRTYAPNCPCPSAPPGCTMRATKPRAKTARQAAAR
jgi:hypothetical protein